MTVKQLIEELSKFDPETEVLGMCTDPTDYTYKVPIDSIELDSPYDTNSYSGIDGSCIDELSVDDYEVLYDEDDEYVGPKVVILNLGII